MTTLCLRTTLAWFLSLDGRVPAHPGTPPKSKRPRSPQTGPFAFDHAGWVHKFLIRQGRCAAGHICLHKRSIQPMMKLAPGAVRSCHRRKPEDAYS